MNTMKYGAWVERKARTTPNLDLSDVEAVDDLFRRYFDGPRVRVVTEYPGGERYERTGRVSVTTGWRPSLLLVHRSSDYGSSDVITPRDRIVAIQHGRTYVPVSNLYHR